jgi:hypothetical protein
MSLLFTLILATQSKITRVVVYKGGFRVNTGQCHSCGIIVALYSGTRSGGGPTRRGVRHDKGSTSERYLVTLYRLNNMVKLPYTVLNAFSSSADTGNAAAVIILPCPESAIDLADPFAAYPSTPALQKVATELNFPMTALLIPKGPAEDGSYLLRWLDPGTEVQLCGHATIALSHYLFSQPGAPARLDLTTVKHGQVISERLSNPLDKEDVRVALDFPEILGFRDIEPSSKEWEDVARGLGQVARSQSSPIRQLRRNDHYLIVELEGDFDMSAKGLPLDMEKLVCPHQRT